MNETFILWFKGLAAAVIGGVANTMVALIGSQVVGVDLSWSILWTVAVSSAVTTALAYLAKSPLPMKGGS